MAWQSILFISAWTLHLVNGQPPPIVGAADPALLAQNAQKFVELYGLATQLMNLGGSIISNAKDYNYYGSSGNGILGEVVRPQLRGVKDYEVSSYNSLAPLSDYGGGPLGSGSGRYQSARQSGLESLLNTFLGSSVSSSSGSSPSIGDFFSPTYQSGSRSPSGSNIDDIINSLIRSGAKQAAPDYSSSSQNILSQFFG